MNQAVGLEMIELDTLPRASTRFRFATAGLALGSYGYCQMGVLFFFILEAVLLFFSFSVAFPLRWQL
jgi:hypothetical protein